MLKREAAMAGASAALEAELNKVRAEYEARLANMEEQHKLAMHRQLVELTGTADEIRALREEKSKEERVELLRRQVTRRIMNAGISRGWTAWHDLYTERKYAVERLREVGNKLRAPDLAFSFQIWEQEMAAARVVAEREQLERENRSVEAQLRRARFEAGQLELIRVAHLDEIKALKERLGIVNDEVVDKETGLRGMPDLKMENETLREQARICQEAADKADAGRTEAEEDIGRERLEHQRLLERLLDEQRRRLEAESFEVRREVVARTDEWAKAAQLRSEAEHQLKTLKYEAGRVEKDLRAESERLAAQVDKLRAELNSEKEALKEARKVQLRVPSPPPPPAVSLKAEPKKRKKGTSPLGQVDLDEGPDAPPIAVQLAQALRTHATRVLDLFRDWDDDGNGEISRAEFHRAMPALGLDVPKKAIDELFNEWDSDGGGAIGYKELTKILRARPPAKEKVSKAKTAMNAISRMQKVQNSLAM